MKRVVLEEFSLSIEVPDDVTVEESVWGDWARIEGATFRMFIKAFVPEGSAFSAEEARARLPRELRVTREEMAERTWRFDFEEADGSVGMTMRVAEPCMLDISTSGTPAERDAVIAAVATLRWR